MIGSNLVTKRMQAYAGNYTKGRSLSLIHI